MHCPTGKVPRAVIALLASVLIITSSAIAQDEENTLAYFHDLLLGSDLESDRALARIQRDWTDAFVAPLAEVMLLSRDRDRRQRIAQILEDRTRRNYGYNGQRWLRWVWNQGVAPMPRYADFKAWLVTIKNWIVYRHTALSGLAGMPPTMIRS